MGGEARYLAVSRRRPVPVGAKVRIATEISRIAGRNAGKVVHSVHVFEIIRVAEQGVRLERPILRALGPALRGATQGGGEQQKDRVSPGMAAGCRCCAAPWAASGHQPSGG